MSRHLSRDKFVGPSERSVLVAQQTSSTHDERMLPNELYDKTNWYIQTKSQSEINYAIRHCAIQIHPPNGIIVMNIYLVTMKPPT